MDADDLVITLKKSLAKLSKSERRRAIESVRDVIRAATFDDAAGDGYEMERCPRCGSVAIVKKGRSGNGGQRYPCRDCGRTFSGSTDRILCVPSSKNRQIRLPNFDTLMLTASGRAGAVAAGPPAA